MDCKRWTEEELMLRELYSKTPIDKLREIFDRKNNAIYSKAESLGLKKCEDYLNSPNSGRILAGSNRGSSTRFKKGRTPWNKGIKYESGGRSIETRFKQGHVPIGTLPVGSERLSKDGYIERKIAEPNKWKTAHTTLWEQHNGALPKGHVVAFKDGNKNNITINNLECISRSELMNRNTVHRYPEELKSTIRQLSKLKKSIQERLNEEQN